MNASIIFLLVAALVTLHFTLASPTNLGSRQGPEAIACTQNADCKAAASYWNDCQKATTMGLPEAPDSAQRNCLCFSGQGYPSHPDWYSKLTSCIQCVESADGINANSVLNPLQALQVNFCTTGELTYDDFVVEAHNIAANAGMPLELPQAVLLEIQSDITESHSSTESDDCTTAKPAKTSAHAAQVTTAPVAKGCNYDNCLRQAIQSESVVFPFCNTYTASVDIATAGHPRYVSMCKDSPTSISSACTCLASAQTPSQAHTSTNGGVATTLAPANPCTHTVTEWTTTVSLVTIYPGQSSSAPGTSTTSCTTTSSSTPIVKPSTSTPVQSPTSINTPSSSPAKSSTSIPVSSSTPVQSPTSIRTSSSTPVQSSTTLQASFTSSVTGSSSVARSSPASPSAAPASTTWVTLPASAGMKACAASSDCVKANSLYYQCLNAQANGNQTGSWNCLCKTNLDEWKSSVINCGTCVANNLPSTLPGGLQSKTLVPDLTILLNTFCNTTDPSIKSSSMQKLDQIGLDVTNDWESPVEFFAMNLLDNPPPANSPSSSVVLSSVGTLTTLATVSTSSGTSTGIHTTSSTRTTSSAQATPTNWITLPPTAAMKQCQANACHPAAQIFNTCVATKLTGKNQDPIFDCFCMANKAQWQNSLSSCTNCIAAALPANNPATGQFQAKVLNQQAEVVRQVFCNQTEAIMSNVALPVLAQFGRVITTSFELPIDFFNMTLLAAPIAKRGDSMLLPGLLDGFHH